MWELFLKWLLIFVGILGGMCIISGTITGLHHSVKNVFGISNDWLFGDGSDTGILPSCILSIGIFSIIGGFFWFVITLLYLRTGRLEENIVISSYGKSIPIIFYGIGINGILGLFYVTIGEKSVANDRQEPLRLIAGLASSGNMGAIIGGMILSQFAEEVLDKSIGVLIGGVIGGPAGGLVGGFLFRNDSILKKISGNDYDNYFGNVFGCWFVGAVVGAMISGALNMTVAIALTEGSWVALFGLFLGMATFFVGLAYGMFSTLIGVPSALAIWGGRSLAQRIAKVIAGKISPFITTFLSLLRFHTIICGGCLQYTSPVKSDYKNGTRYCKHCQKEVERTKDVGKIIFIFGTFPLEPKGRMFLISNPGFQMLKQQIDISEVYLDTKSCDPLRLERFITYIVNYPPKHGARSVRIVCRGNLDDLGENLKNALHNTFTQVEQMA